jgi:hypothetical protein
LKDKITEIELNSKNKNIRDLYKGITEFKKGYQPKTNLVKDERGSSTNFDGAGHVACMGEERKVYKVLVGKPEGKRGLGRPRRRWEDGVRMDLRKIGLGSVDWIRLAQDRDRWRAVVSAVINLWVLAPRS